MLAGAHCALLEVHETDWFSFHGYLQPRSQGVYPLAPPPTPLPQPRKKPWEWSWAIRFYTAFYTMMVHSGQMSAHKPRARDRARVGMDCTISIETSKKK